MRAASPRANSPSKKASRRRKDAKEQAAALLERVGFRSGQMAKHPHEFSGGQR